MASLSKGKSKSSAIPENVTDCFITRANDIGAELAHGEHDSKQESATCPLKEEPYGSIPTVAVGTEETESTKQSLISKRSGAETKSRRFQCVFKPSTFDRMQKKAAADGISVNDLLNQFAELYIEGKI